MIRLFKVFKLSIFPVVLFLVACGPSKEEVTEQSRIECQDRICEGDIIPELGPDEAVLKVNGQWFIGPREFYSSGNNRTEFEWWEHKPLSRLEPRPPEAQALAVAGRGYDISIEIFFSSRNQESESSDLYSILTQAEAAGRVISKDSIKPGLDLWKVSEVETPISYDWFIATELREPSGAPPVIACRGNDPQVSRCTTGFVWQPGISIDMRFRVTHASDWPEIYQETIRVLQLLRKG